MKLLKLYLPVICLLIGVIAFSQPSPGAKKGFFSKVNVNLGAGLANYYGDLTQNAHYFYHSSFVVSAGVSYPIIRHLNARFDLAYMKVGAQDRWNSRPELRNRNLGFRTYIWDASIAAEYEFRDLTRKKLSPYVFIGFGAFYFNPYTRDANGYKQFLQPLGTEGQGLTAYPDRKFYKRVQTEIPFGWGLKYRCKKVTWAMEFKYRHTSTDYIDDVSLSGYPDKALLDARNPRTATLTYRGNEVGAGPYPAPNSKLNRGNPKKKDSFYTMELKVAFPLAKNR